MGAKDLGRVLGELRLELPDHGAGLYRQWRWHGTPPLRPEIRWLVICSRILSPMAGRLASRVGGDGYKWESLNGGKSFSDAGR